MPFLSQEVSKLQIAGDGERVWRKCCCLCLCALGHCQKQTNGQAGLLVWSARLLASCKPFLSSLGLFWGYLWSFWSSVQHLWCLAPLLNLQFVTSVISNVISWFTSSLRWSPLWSVNTYCKLIIYPVRMEDSCFSMTVDSSVPKFAFRSKMFEKVTCYFSFSNLEF